MDSPQYLRLGSACLLALCASAFSALAETSFEVVRDWPALPAEHTFGLCAGAGVDSQNDVFVFHRNGRAWSVPLPPHSN